VTPNVFNFELWKTSGHADHYRENMFAFDVEKQVRGGLGWLGGGWGVGGGGGRLDEGLGVLGAGGWERAADRLPPPVPPPPPPRRFVSSP
jgi:hypothetical protein